MIAHKENKYFHPQKYIAHSIKNFAELLILMQCINKLYLSTTVTGFGISPGGDNAYVSIIDLT